MMTIPTFNQRQLPLTLKRPQVTQHQMPNQNPWAEKICDVFIRPKGQDDFVIDAHLNSKGQILQRTLPGYQVLGQMESNGNYSLSNGIRGNLFSEPYLRLGENQDWYNSQNPFLKALKSAEQRTALANSEIPLLRQQLTNKGLTGQGIKIGILDPFQRNENGQWQVTDHTKLVASIIQDPLWGVAPSTQVVPVGHNLNAEMFPPLQSDNFSEFISHVVQRQSQCYIDEAQQIQKLLALPNRDPALRVLNITYGRTRISLYNETWSLLHQMDKNQYYKFPQLRRMIFGSTLQDTEDQQVQIMIRFIDSILDTHPTFRFAHQQYIEATRQAALSGITIAVSMANEHGAFPYNFPLHPEAEIDELAKSPYVIAVAASTTNKTPGNRFDDRPTSVSSRGDGFRWNPTITAPGSKLGLSFPIGNTAHNMVTGGTSVATPYVCGVIALMLQRNPFLTFEQIKGKLQTTAVKSPDYSIADVGAGFLNPEAAVYA